MRRSNANDAQTERVSTYLQSFIGKKLSASDQKLSAPDQRLSAPGQEAFASNKSSITEQPNNKVETFNPGHSTPPNEQHEENSRHEIPDECPETRQAVVKSAPFNPGADQAATLETGGTEEEKLPETTNNKIDILHLQDHKSDNIDVADHAQYDQISMIGSKTDNRFNKSKHFLLFLIYN